MSFHYNNNLALEIKLPAVINSSSRQSYKTFGFVVKHMNHLRWF